MGTSKIGNSPLAIGNVSEPSLLLGIETDFSQ